MVAPTPGTGHDGSMAKRTSKPADVNRRAAAVVAQAVGDTDDAPVDHRAVESGREGGRSRAAKLTPEQRSESARKAAEARWGAS